MPLLVTAAGTMTMTMMPTTVMMTLLASMVQTAAAVHAAAPHVSSFPRQWTDL